MEYLNIIFQEVYKIFFLLVPVLVSVAMIVWLDRRVWAFVQKRQGPNVVGPFGLLQSLADAQIIDFVDLNSNTTTDLGSGGGMPGIIVAIILKNMKNNMNVHLYEKSYHKSHFLREVSHKLNLNTKVFQKNIFEIKNLETGTIMSRAFKPMPVVLDLVYENFTKYKNLIFFMGKSGKKIFENSKKNWEFDYTEKKSLTNKDSFLINIKKIKKKN